MSLEVLTCLRSATATGCAVLLAVILLGCGGSKPDAKTKPSTTRGASPERAAAQLEPAWSLEHQARQIDIGVSAGHMDAVRRGQATPLFLERSVPPTAQTNQLAQAVRKTSYAPTAAASTSPATAIGPTLSSPKWTLEQFEMHLEQFQPPTGASPANPVYNFEAHRRADGRRQILRGKTDDRHDSLLELTVLERPDSAGAFEAALTLSATPPRPGLAARVAPLILHDTDGDGRSEILCLSLNQSLQLQSDGSFTNRPLFSDLGDLRAPAVLGDFDGDGFVDIITATADGRLERYPGTARGFDAPRQPAFAHAELKEPQCLSSGDIDGDGDLDLFLGQYRAPYADWHLPQPYYDANDGRPSFVLENDGAGRFTDVSERAGLDPRRRRCYSASFVDLDGDHDLDLVTVNDFAGIDRFENQGDGRFTHSRGPYLFGMGHCIGDFDGDGNPAELYAIGMSSTTARRLDAMADLSGSMGPEAFPEHNRRRQAMGYGNRLLVSTDDGFEAAPLADSVARTGWSWGVTSFDMDNDGDREFYVANGHKSGRSCVDYCTHFWTRDIYLGAFQGNPELAPVINEPRGAYAALRRGDISWNGYEHNVLWSKLGGDDQPAGYENIAYLLGVANERDARAVASDDVDGDGRMDLIVTDLEWHGAVSHETVRVYLNELADTGNWIGLRLPPDCPPGTRVEVRAGDRRQAAVYVTGDSFHSQHAPAFHFGLGSARQIDAASMIALDGKRRELGPLDANRWHAVAE